MAARKKAVTLDTVQQYADHRGVSRQAVYKAISESKIPFQNGLIDRELADQQWAENSARGAATDEPAPSNRPTLNGAQTLLALRRAEKVGLEISREKKEIEDQIRMAAAEHHRIITEALDALPARLTPLVAVGVPRAEYLRIQNVIKEQCRRLAAEIATGGAA